MKDSIRHLFYQSAGSLLPYLEDPDIMEIRVTSTGRTFVIKFGLGKSEVERTAEAELDGFLAVTAHMVGGEWSEISPRLHAANAALGIRIQASRPPVSPGIEMVLRKHPKTVFPLEDFVQKEILTAEQATLLIQAVCERKTLVFSGSTGSAKTSVLNAVLQVIEGLGLNIIIVEDDPEIHCNAAEVRFQRCVKGYGDQPDITMRDLCKDLLRFSPDVIVIGEFRGGEALDAMKAFQTGHQGLCTVHAESALETLSIIEQRIQEVSESPQQYLIGQAVDMICHMEKYGHRWRMTALVEVERFDGTQYITRSLVEQCV